MDKQSDFRALIAGFARSLEALRQRPEMMRGTLITLTAQYIAGRDGCEGLAAVCRAERAVTP